MTRWIFAIAAGLLLGTLPFWRFVPLAERRAHMDHAPRHGGQLGMAGDHHIELVRHARSIEVFVSDAARRPIRPREGRVVFDGTSSAPLRWQNHRLIGADRPEAREVEAIVITAEGTRVAIGFVFDRR